MFTILHNLNIGMGAREAIPVYNDHSVHHDYLGFSACLDFWSFLT